MAVEPLDGDDPHVFSKNVAVTPYSFVDENQKYDEEAPPPTYLPWQIISRKLPTSKEDLFKDLEFCEHGGLRCVNEEAMERQKGVFASIVREFAKSFFKGQGISHISLPVKMFEPRSTLQRVVDCLSYAPLYLKRAAETDDPLERMKLTICTTMACIHMCTGQLKPFNPILGETLQCKMDDGSKIFAEHISHHPPITNLLYEGPEDAYKYWGSIEFTASMGANHLKAGQEGNQYIYFKEYDHKIRFTCPKYTLGGTVVGDRTMNVDHWFEFHDETFGYKAVIIFNPIMKSGGIFSADTYAGKYDEFRGMIYVPDPKKPASEKYKKWSHIQDVKKELSKIEGSWLRNLCFDGEEYWNVDWDECRPFRQVPEKVVLPSDWRYREDLIWLERGNLPNADAWKKRQEIQQRWDRKLRKEAKKLKEGIE